MEMKCPACGAINRENTWQCVCGHYFVTSKKETTFPVEQIASQAMSKRTAPIPREPAVATPEEEPSGPIPKEEHRKFNYRWERFRLFGRGVVKVTLLLLVPALWIAGGVAVFPELLDVALPILLLFILLFCGFGLLLFWITNILSVHLIGEKTCYLSTSRFWSYETELLIDKLRARKRKLRGI